MAETKIVRWDAGMYTTKEVAALLGVSRKGVDKWRRERSDKIPTPLVFAGGSNVNNTRWDKAGFDRWMADREEPCAHQRQV